MRFVLATAAAAILMSACATAPVAETKLAENGEQTRQICRPMNTTGSNRVTRMCTTARQWQELDEKVKAEQDKQNERGQKDLDRLRAPNVSPANAG